VKVLNRLMLELMARGGMRNGKVSKLRFKDVDERRLTLISPESGKQSETVYISQPLSCP
jgi:integrase